MTAVGGESTTTTWLTPPYPPSVEYTKYTAIELRKNSTGDFSHLKLGHMTFNKYFLKPLLIITSLTVFRQGSNVIYCINSTCTNKHTARDSSVSGIDYATGWTVRGSKPGGGEISRASPDRHWDPPSLLYSGYRVSFLRVKRLWRGAVHPSTPLLPL